MYSFNLEIDVYSFNLRQMCIPFTESWGRGRGLVKIRKDDRGEGGRERKRRKEIAWEENRKGR